MKVAREKAANEQAALEAKAAKPTKKAALAAARSDWAPLPGYAINWSLMHKAPVYRHEVSGCELIQAAGAAVADGEPYPAFHDAAKGVSA